jgi:methyl-accepting chemotaxis protein
VKLVGQIGTVLSSIVSVLSEINTFVLATTRSAQIQAAGLQQVNAAVSELIRLTQQNAAIVEEATAAARLLAQRASSLAGIGQLLIQQLG